MLISPWFLWGHPPDFSLGCFFIYCEQRQVFLTTTSFTSALRDSPKTFFHPVSYICTQLLSSPKYRHEKVTVLCSVFIHSVSLVLLGSVLPWRFWGTSDLIVLLPMSTISPDIGSFHIHRQKNNCACSRQWGPSQKDSPSSSHWQIK